MKDVKEWKPTAIMTHTRFFIPSFIGGLFAKIARIKWIHIEHGSGWVDTGNRIINLCSYMYDQIIGRWILRYSNKQVCVSKDVERFIQSKF